MVNETLPDDILDIDEFLRRLEHFLQEGKGSPSFSRGSTYAASGAVSNIETFEDGQIFAKVNGTRRQPYRLHICPDIWMFGEGLDGDCSCPVGSDCKHSYAVAIRMLGEISQHAPWAVQWAQSYLPRQWSRGVNPLPPCHFEGIHPWTYVEKQGGKNDEDADWWRDFLDAASPPEAEAILHRGIQKRCVPLPRFYMHSIGAYLMQRFPSRVELLRNLNIVLGEQYRQISSHLQEEPQLLEWLASPEAVAFHEEEARSLLLLELNKWTQSTHSDRSEPEDHVDIEWSIDEGDAYSLAPKLCFRVYLTSKKLRRSPRNSNAFQTLVRAVQESRRTLPPLQTELINWIDEHQGQSYGPFQESAFPVVSALSWLQHWGNDGLLKWDNGAPVTFAAEAARLTMTVDDDNMRWSAQCKDFATPRPLEDFTIISDESTIATNGDYASNLYLREGNQVRFLDTKGIPSSLLHSILRQATLPTKLLREHGLGVALMDRFQQMGLTTDASLVQKVPVRFRVSFYFGSDQTLHARFLAQGPEETAFERQASGRWLHHRMDTEEKGDYEDLQQDPDASAPEVVDSNIPASAPNTIAYAPRDEDIALIEDWIDRIVPPFATLGRTPSGHVSLQWKLRDQGFETFFAAWEERPPQTDYLGNAAMRALITLRTPPRYKVTVKPSGIQWLDVSLDTQRDVDALSYEEVEEALRTQDSAQIMLPKRGRYRRDDLEAYRQELETFAQLGIAAQEGKQRVHALQLGATNLDAVPELAVNMAELLRHARELSQSFKGITRAPLTKTLKETLRHYQRDGVDFCVWACKNFGGAILADDMGLGKTLQVLATLTALRRGVKDKKPSLVVCPASVTHNWQREAARFTPKLRTVILERGPERKKILQELHHYDLVIKNYALARRDIEELREQDWQLVCVDEAQAIKNPDAAITYALNSLKADYRIALTGTPIENRLTDLWSISNFAVPGYLPKDEMGEKKITEAASALEYRRLRARLRPILLRRIKQEVAPELPPRIEERLDCAMTAGQRRAYLVELKRAQLLLEEAKTKKVSGPDRIQILAALTRLRQICCDPALRDMPRAGSGKVKVFLDQLSELIESGQKVLVFSQFVTMLELLAPKLTDKGIPYFMLTGKTQKRAELVADFEATKEPSAFLISLKAGGSGLNLVSASHVILFDPWWNPAVEAQAIDRTHRIGQDKTVLAYRLVTEDSIEERILELQEKKRALVSNVLEADSFNRSLTRDDFAFLLK